MLRTAVLKYNNDIGAQEIKNYKMIIIFIPHKLYLCNQFFF